MTVKSKSAKSKQDEGETEARAIDMKVKSAEGDTGGQSNNELLKKMQDEKWEKYEWIDENVRVTIPFILFYSIVYVLLANASLFDLGPRIVGEVRRVHV